MLPCEGRAEKRGAPPAEGGRAGRALCTGHSAPSARCLPAAPGGCGIFCAVVILRVPQRLRCLLNHQEKLRLCSDGAIRALQASFQTAASGLKLSARHPGSSGGTTTSPLLFIQSPPDLGRVLNSCFCDRSFQQSGEARRSPLPQIFFFFLMSEIKCIRLQKLWH